MNIDQAVKSLGVTGTGVAANAGMARRPALAMATTAIKYLRISTSLA
jgi:hypothetical protein